MTASEQLVVRLVNEEIETLLQQPFVDDISRRSVTFGYRAAGNVAERVGMTTHRVHRIWLKSELSR